MKTLLTLVSENMQELVEYAYSLLRVLKRIS